jgi:polysaccharide pyruvyl transferase WcaK-like protein
MARSILVITDQTKNIGDHLLRLQVLHFLRTRLDSPTLRACEWEAVDDNGSDLASELPPLSMKRQPLRAGASALGADLVIGPGQMIRDNMGVWFLIALVLLVLISRGTGRQSYIVAVSVGRMSSWIHKVLWTIITSLSNRVSFRDSTSLKRAEEIFGLNDKFSKTSDLAFLASPYLSPLSERSGSKATPPPFVIVAPCNDPGEGRFLTINRAVAIAVAAASAAGCDRVLFVAHDVREDADEKLATDCCTYFREQHGSAAMTASCLAPKTIDAIVEAYAEAGVVVTNRLHAALLGVLAGKVVFSIEDGSGKLRKFSDEFALGTVYDEDMQQLEIKIRDALSTFNPDAYAPAIHRNRQDVYATLDHIVSPVG